jgi:hypothetical protein
LFHPFVWSFLCSGSFRHSHWFDAIFPSLSSGSIIATIRIIPSPSTVAILLLLVSL